MFKKQKIDINEIIRMKQRIDRYRKSGNTVQMKRWSTRLSNIEAQLRKTANSRLKRLRSRGLDVLDNDRFKAWIIQSGGKNARYLRKPKDINALYTQTLTVLRFLNTPESTIRGMTQRLKDIKEMYEKEGVKFETEEQLREFYVWRKQRPIAEFFTIFPPSPQEIMQDTARATVNLFIEGGERKEMLEDYINEFYDYLKTQDDDEPQGITASLLVQRIKDLTDNPRHRRRRGYIE